MKKIISIVTVAFSFNLFATSLKPTQPSQGVEANMFTCEAGDTQVSYTTTSFIGKPTMSVTFQGVNAKLNGDVRSEKTVLGRLVSSDDNHLVPVDGPTIRYAIFIPNVKLVDNATPVDFETVALRTTIVNPFFAPRGSQSFTNTESVNVKCNAQFVWF